jgi:hypothetical protein
MIYKETIGNELYVYMNGSLLYKRWLKLNYGRIFGCQVYIQSFVPKEIDKSKIIC